MRIRSIKPGVPLKNLLNFNYFSLDPVTLSTTDSPFFLRKVIERMRANQAAEKGAYLAMYSSISGGITTDPAAMVIPMDDHMVHRGHGVFDTAAIADG